MNTERLTKDFFAQSALEVAPALLGTKLVRKLSNNVRLESMIVEVEAYTGFKDLASHGVGRAGKAKRTIRNAPMYDEPGKLYMYLIYGNYWMLNIVCESVDQPAAVLIRAAEPLIGIKIMAQNRRLQNFTEEIQNKNLLSGPGKLAQAYDLQKIHNGLDITNPLSEVWMETHQTFVSDKIATSPRVGLSKQLSEPWLSKPWRWYVKENMFVSG